MAGGKGSRLGYVEKPLIKIDNKYLIDIVINSLLNSREIDKIFIATSPYTKNTKKYLLSKYKNYDNIFLVDTYGFGFIVDINYCFKYFNNPFLVVSSDIIVDSETINNIISYFKGLNVEALSVYIPKDKYVGSTKPYKNLVPAGINILSPKCGYQKEEVYILDRLILNINTKYDLDLVKLVI